MRPRARLDMAAVVIGSLIAASCSDDPDRGEGAGGTGGQPAAGPDEVAIQSADGTVYYVDRTEVTRDAYAAWLATSPSAPVQIEPCRENDDFTPTCKWPPADLGQHPVVCVDWCDAVLCCQAQGKRLCGLIAGGPNDYHDYAKPELDQWYNACSAQGSNEYPYGSPYEPHVCNGALHGRGSPAPVGSMPGCRTAAGLVDMSGNIREWKDACETRPLQWVLGHLLHHRRRRLLGQRRLHPDVRLHGELLQPGVHRRMRGSPSGGRPRLQPARGLLRAILQRIVRLGPPRKAPSCTSPFIGVRPRG